jgi:Xaa-Pro aminopeptidase
MLIEAINEGAVVAMTGSAREATWRAVHHIKEMIKPGITEKEAISLANQYFASQGVKKFWHKTHIRFGASTVLGFDDPYHDRVVLRENDIFYIDVGPVWGAIEGDCGETFAIGCDRDHMQICSDVKSLFNQVKRFWKEHSPTGVELYDYAYRQASEKGYVMHPSYVKGHRLSEFSHFKYGKDSVGDLDFKPAPERWVLEFQICHPSMKFGAFYEDLLF